MPLGRAARCRADRLHQESADDLGWKDVGCYAGHGYDTRAMEALVKQRMRFTDAYAACVGAPWPAARVLVCGRHAP